MRGFPTIEEARRLVETAEAKNPGPWVGHSRTAAHCARAIWEQFFGRRDGHL